MEAVPAGARRDDARPVEVELGDGEVVVAAAHDVGAHELERHLLREDLHALHVVVAREQAPPDELDEALERVALVLESIACTKFFIESVATTMELSPSV